MRYIKSDFRVYFNPSKSTAVIFKSKIQKIVLMVNFFFLQRDHKFQFECNEENIPSVL